MFFINRYNFFALQRLIATELSIFLQFDQQVTVDKIMTIQNIAFTSDSMWLYFGDSVCRPYRRCFMTPTKRSAVHRVCSGLCCMRLVAESLGAGLASLAILGEYSHTVPRLYPFSGQTQ